MILVPKKFYYKRYQLIIQEQIGPFIGIFYLTKIFKITLETQYMHGTSRTNIIV